MGIVNLKPDSTAIAEEINTLPEAIQEPSKSIFTTLVPESKYTSLLQYVEGYPWTVYFYGQIINDNNTLTQFDPSSPNLTQPYYEVRDMVLQVTSPLSSNYDQTTGITTVTGSALTPYKLKPNPGDLIIAKVDNDQDAIFVITTVERKTYRKDTVYEINYSLFSYVSAEPTFYATLLEKVQQTYYFDQTANFTNRENLIKPSVKEAIDRLARFMYESQDYYFNQFVQPITGSLCVPGATYVANDILLMNFIMETCSYDHPYFKRMNVFNYMNISMYQQPSILKAIRERNKALLSILTPKYHFISSAAIDNHARLGTPYFTMVDYIIVPDPIDTRRNIKDLDWYPEDLSDGLECRTDNNYNNFFNATVDTFDGGTRNLLHTLFDNNYYIVSQNFYDYLNQVPGAQMSYIESLIMKFLNNEAIAKEDLAVAVQTYYQWSLLHQFYLLPVLWHIIRNS